MTTDHRRLVAAHEAGHVVACWLIEEPIHAVRLDDVDGGVLGVTTTTPDDDAVLWLLATLAGGATARAFGHSDGADADDLRRAREAADPELFAAVERLSARLARTRPFRRLVEVVAAALLERGALDGADVEELLEREWVSSWEGGEMDERPASQRELDIRQLVLMEAGIVPPPDDVDEELRLYTLLQDLKRWRRNWWHLGPGSSAPDDSRDDLPDEIAVMITIGDEQRSMTLTRGQVDHAVERGYTLRTTVESDGSKNHALIRSRSSTRAMIGGQMIDEIEER
jgi:hypothetical protein